MIERVRQFYDRNVDSEWNRLTHGLSVVEFATTMRLIDKYFPRKGRILDIGGGPGRYAIELARKGYEVSLFDLSKKLLERARIEFNRAGCFAKDIVEGSAEDLGVFNSLAFDGALMLGPLIHLTTHEQRIKALAELKRILVNGGIALVQYLNSWGLIRTGLTDFPSWYDIPEKIRAMLQDQVLEDTLSGFTDCYWTTPSIALDEIREAGFDVISYAGAEGFLGGMAGIVEEIKRSSRKRYENIVTTAALMAELPQFRDSTDHLVYILQKK